MTLFPVGLDIPNGRCIGIRAFITRDFMTGSPALPGRDIPMEALEEMRKVGPAHQHMQLHQYSPPVLQQKKTHGLLH